MAKRYRNKIFGVTVSTDADLGVEWELITQKDDLAPVKDSGKVLNSQGKELLPEDEDLIGGKGKKDKEEDSDGAGTAAGRADKSGPDSDSKRTGARSGSARKS